MTVTVLSRAKAQGIEAHGGVQRVVVDVAKASARSARAAMASAASRAACSVAPWTAHRRSTAFGAPLSHTRRGALDVRWRVATASCR
jgi:hypothetical protein